jgi:antitoxin component of MazEF toxin-antitoxin module
MNAKIIRVGNSSGVVLPSVFLKMLGVETGAEVRLEYREKMKEIVLKPKVRDGWEEAFKMYASEGADALLIPDVFEDEALWEY